ncbi:MAG: indole-3-glycerol phosphate synthase TrpC [Bacteroidota bacterium]
MSILQGILENKRKEVEAAKQSLPFDQLKKLVDSKDRRSFSHALRSSPFSLIAEIKKASPSRGVLTARFDPVELAREYERLGATVLSVLTDTKYFQGQKEFIKLIKAQCSLAVLRKDFILDDYQVYESRFIGADAILLIVKILTDQKLSQLYQCARDLGLDVLFETHNDEEIQRANRLGAEIIGINNRDLDSFEVTIDLCLKLRPNIAKRALAIAESGIKSAADVEKVRTAGFDAMLVGEGLIVEKNRNAVFRELMSR